MKKIWLLLVLVVFLVSCSKYEPVASEQKQDVASEINVTEILEEINETKEAEYLTDTGVIRVMKQFSAFDPLIFNVTKKVYIGPDSWVIYQWYKETWKPLRLEASCDINSYRCTGYKEYCGLYSACSSWSGCAKAKDFEWDRKHHTGYKPIYCEYDDEIIEWTCALFATAEPGRYKVELSYSEDCPDPSNFGKGTIVKKTSAEFEIV